MEEKPVIQTRAQASQIKQRRETKALRDERDTLRLQIKELLEKNNKLLDNVYKKVNSIHTVAKSNKKEIKELKTLIPTEKKSETQKE